ncbi:MAG: lytic transglycosylase domain-containing protein [Bdellovibrionales bacterium]|nr:lytic transglycosylase domain-containing protein [Bdellovibrionales bacterium]
MGNRETPRADDKDIAKTWMRSLRRWGRGGRMRWVTVPALVLFGAWLPAPAEAGPLYSYTSGRGVVTFTSVRPTGKNFRVIQPRSPRRSRFVSSGRGTKWIGRPTRSKYDELIRQMAVSYKLEPSLVKAVVHAESSFNPRALSPKGAGGLMQLMPATARRFGVSDVYSPVENVVGGVRYLRWLYERFDGNVVHVIAGYNAGENAVSRYGGIPPYSETQTYVKRVLRLRDSYRCDYTGQKSC